MTSRHPALRVLVGSLLIAWAGIYVRLSELPATTSAFFRCVYALPVLLALYWWYRRSGRITPLTSRQRRWAAIAGTSFGVDLVLWHVSIGLIGAGLSTVLANIQVVLFPLGAWLVWRERPGVRQIAVLPLLVIGIVLISGVVGTAAFGSDPVRGAITGVLTGVAYTGFLLALRAAVPPAGELPIETLAISTAFGAIVTGTSAVVAGTLELVPTWPAHGWILMLAWTCQVFAWLLIAGSLTRVAAARVSILLLLQPVTALLLGVLVLAEAPSAAQTIGALLVLGGVLVGGRRQRTT